MSQTSELPVATASMPSQGSTYPTTHFINGRWLPREGRTFPDFNPYTGAIVAEIAAGGRAEAESAVNAAHAAFPAWAAMIPAERQRLFLKAADITERRVKDIAQTLALETGSSLPFSMLQIRWSANLMRQAANWGYLPYGDVLRSDIPGRFAMATRKALGVVAGFTPWNGAFNLAWRTIVLPMAFGNTVVIKPSELAPISAGLLQAEILEEAGFPNGTINVITHAPGEASTIADVFFESPAVRSINFTGSDKTARILGERAGRALKRSVLELGGYNPLLVLADADVENAVNAAAFGAFFHQGQICMNTRKVFIERPLHDEFVEKLIAKTLKLKSGDPTRPDTIIGPLINEQALQSVTERVRDAVDRGAHLMTGGTAHGLVYEATVLTHVPEDAVITDGRQETFGPVLVVEAVDSAEQALSRAQATPYGLSAGIMTSNQARGLELAQRFDTGIVHVNSSTMGAEPSLPNGGVKDSGWGRSGHYAIEDFTEIRLTTLTEGAARYPF